MELCKSARCTVACAKMGNCTERVASIRKGRVMIAISVRLYNVFPSLCKGT